MKPGPELDALIEKHVFKRTVEWISGRPFWVGDDLPGTPWELERWADYDGSYKYGHAIDPYSDDIARAWKVVEKFDRVKVERYGSHRALCFLDGEGVYGETVPHAICLAALKAVGVIVPECQ